MGMKALQSCKPPLRGATLIEDLQRQLHNPSFYDVIIVCDGKEFAAHKFILAARSTVFKGFNIRDHSEWNVMPCIMRGTNFYLFAALYCSCLGFTALLASLRYEGLH